jgi:sRNA-binding carbon storage regulator CsrA
MVEIIRRPSPPPRPVGTLTVARKVGEVIYVDLPSGERLAITVRSALSGLARIAVTAPLACRIWRSELEDPTP